MIARSWVLHLEPSSTHCVRGAGYCLSAEAPHARGVGGETMTTTCRPKLDLSTVALAKVEE
jgi:hypothetical protein